MDDNGVLCLAWLLKKSRATHHWNKRWFVLRKRQLSYYKSSSEHKPRKVFLRDDLLAYARVVNAHKYQFSVYTHNKILHLRAETQQEYEKWCEVFDEFFNDADLSNDEDFSNDEEPERATGDRTSLVELSKENDGGEYLVEEGEIYKFRGRYNQWRKIYLIVTNLNLYMCKSSDKTRMPRKVLGVDNLVDVVEVDGTRGKKWCLMLITNTKSYQLSADSEQEMTKFLSAIKAVILLDKAKHGEEADHK